jgi:hypothetical protein
MANGSWIPLKDGDFETFTNNFKTLVASNPATYGLQNSDSTAITNAYNSWHTAYLAATNGSTRTHGTIATKNQQKANLLTVIRGYGATIRANKAVTVQAKHDLGVTVADTQPTPVPPPTTMPVLEITKIATGYQEVLARDEGAGTSRARPHGSAGLLLYRAVGDTAANDPSTATFLTFVGRPSVQSTFPGADRGKTATYFARWTNAKGEVGPWSQPVSGCIAA